MKNTKSGISLIVLVITIIVIIILSAAVIITLNNNNPIDEAGNARYSSDLDNMQSVLTNTIAKIMVEKQAVVTIPSVQTIGEDAIIKYDIEDSVDGSLSGNIIFQKGNNSSNTYYTDVLLPNYKNINAIWVIDTDARLYLQIGDTPNEKIFPQGTAMLPVS